ncbi:hypothetical protein HYPSUDRAFT_365767 [Hypholoma sublateritium FD-334 SS-4]|uniref:F-box domain-containing protein n=1 Tax=Hypholoma sublateritium (strain FD-334 SS-4) TaxID=945553 RepID=A0A0D2LX76_HYPSF|nr:hypothetical protein HYPSUDRAFT_365767 [Hypholoma sublateritium FD-334 SS-4]
MFEPELYRVVRSGKGRVVPPLYIDSLPREDVSEKARQLNLERLQRFGPWVHHILLQCRPVHEVAQVLTACPNVHNLALWIIQGAGAPLVPLLARLPLRRLSFDPRSFFALDARAPDGSVPLGQAPFDALTHLEVINVTAAWDQWRQLALLPRLTHLVLGCGMPSDAPVERVLEECAALEVLVLPYTDVDDILLDNPTLAEVQKDPRVVLLNLTWDPLDEWEVGARGGEDLWVTAEKRVKKARGRKTEDV